MRIQKIDIKNYKVFYGSHQINVDGKNLFVYGENGSGKSSFFHLQGFYIIFLILLILYYV